MKSYLNPPALGLTMSLAAALPATSGIITFDPADGYALGTSLVVNSDWSGNGALYSITSLGGGNGAALSGFTPQGAFSKNTFTPDAAFLGDTDTLTAGKTYDFSFDLRNDSTGSLSDFGQPHRIRFGGTDGSPIISFEVFNNGRLQIGGTNAVNINNASLDLDDTVVNGVGRFITIEGTIDIDAGTFDVSVDGVAQGTFSTINTPANFGDINFIRGNTNGGNGDADPVRQIAIDNLSVAVPEPASLTLAALGGLAMLRRRR